MSLTVLSLGAGVQSSTLALMLAAGEIGPMPDCAIFADTQAEPKAVYDWLTWLETKLPYPVHRVTGGDLGANALKRELLGEGSAMVPFFSVNGMGRRQCTSHYKIAPIVKQVRELLGVKKGEHVPAGTMVSQLIGISTDEADRAKPSDKFYIKHRWPLIEAGMSRAACLSWMERNGYPKPAKSACYFCPYHDDALWKDMKAHAPLDWERAVRFDAAIGTVGIRLHQSRLPLSAVDFRNAEEAGQFRLFSDECEGMCGV